MLPETTLELAKIKNVVAMKEASGNMEQIMELVRLKPEGFDVLSGDDALTLPLISIGVSGVISVVANAFPEKFSKMVRASMKDDMKVARKEHFDLFTVTKMLFEEGNPAGVKIVLEERGIIKSAVRLPLFQVSEDLKIRIIAETKRLLNA
jgi:4-hydroxy-tetrahydrodipicolinate synthase